MKLLRPFYYLYYRRFKLYSRWSPGWDPAPQLTALFMTTAIVWCHIYFVIAATEWRLGRAFFPHISKTDIAVTYAALMLPLYFWLVYRKRFIRIAGQFEGETTRKSVRPHLTMRWSEPLDAAEPRVKMLF